MTPFQKALPFAKRGWFLFPSFWNGTNHIGLVRWGTGSSNDVKVMEEWSKKWPDAYFCVNLEASGLINIDVDNKNGKFGSEVLKSLPELPITMKATTPNGGEHYYFVGDCQRGANKLGIGVDLPHMSPLPGQTVPGKGTYALVQRGVPAILPKFVSSIAGTKRENKERSLDRDKDITTSLDEKASIKIAIQYLTERAPEAVEGSGGDSITYNVICRTRDFGISQEKAVELLSTYWNNSKAFPPWPESELERKISNAYLYARDTIGNSSVESMFPDLPETKKELVKSDLFLCAADLKLSDLKPRDWLLGYRYLPGFITLTIAPGGAGKSVLTLLEGLAIASGKQLTYDAVKRRAPVWVLNTEDPKDELNRRVWATAAHYGLKSEDLVDFHYGSAYEDPLVYVMYDEFRRAVTNEKLIKWTINLMKENHIQLLVVDPFVECHLVDENDNMAINMVAQAFRRIAKEAGAAVSLVHHTNKGDTNVHGNADKSRGASSLVSAARIAHTFYSMAEKEAKDYGIDPKMCDWYSRLDSAKGNLSPPGGGPQWFMKKSFKMSWDSNETIGVLEKHQLDKRERSEEDEIIMNEVMALVDAGTEVSTFKLGHTLNDSGMFDVKQRALTNKIDAIFRNPIVLEGYEYGIRLQEGKTSKAVKHVYCEYKECSCDEG